MENHKVEIRADPVKNRLTLILAGFFHDTEAVDAADRCIAGISKLKTGFDIIADISNFKPATPVGAEEIKRVQLYSIQHGVKRTVRIVGQAFLAQSQFNRQVNDSKVAMHTAGSIKEAEHILDSAG